MSMVQFAPARTRAQVPTLTDRLTALEAQTDEIERALAAQNTQMADNARAFADLATRADKIQRGASAVTR